jgi:hypothetical protein
MDADVAEADQIRARERARLRALVAGDLKAAREFHADDFRLITPRGDSWSKEEYLGVLAMGALKYLVWEPGAIDVRVYGEAAVIRYQSQTEALVNGQKRPLGPIWHIDLYERRQGRWQVVWSQATAAP